MGKPRYSDHEEIERLDKAIVALDARLYSLERGFVEPKKSWRHRVVLELVTDSPKRPWQMEYSMLSGIPVVSRDTEYIG